MQRHRQVAAAPERKASETWEAIGQLVVATLERSPHITRSDVAAAMRAAGPVGVMLVAGGHLETHPLVIVADPVYLSVTTVSGGAAMRLDEDLGPVPGGAAARDWTIYVPTPDPVGGAVRAALGGSPHLSSAAPPAESVAKSEKAAGASVLNLDALAKRARESE